MTRFWRWAIAVAAMCVCAALTGWSWRWATRPAMLSLAVGPPGFDDAQLAEAFSRLLAADKSPVRLSIVHTGGPIKSITKLTRGEVQLAITRTDIKVGDSARAVARLHSDPVVIFATTRSGAMEFTDLKGD